MERHQSGGVREEASVLTWGAPGLGARGGGRTQGCSHGHQDPAQARAAAAHLRGERDRISGNLGLSPPSSPMPDSPPGGKQAPKEVRIPPVTGAGGLSHLRAPTIHQRSTGMKTHTPSPPPSQSWAEGPEQKPEATDYASTTTTPHTTLGAHPWHQVLALAQLLLLTPPAQLQGDQGLDPTWPTAGHSLCLDLGQPL